MNAKEPNPKDAISDAFNKRNRTINRRHRWMAGLLALPSLAGLLLLFFFFIRPFRTFVFRNFLGSTAYYAYIESSCEDELPSVLQQLGSYDSKNISTQTLSGTGTLSLTLNDSLQKQLGFTNDQLDCTLSSACKDGRSQCSYAFQYKGAPLFTIETAFDPSTRKNYIRIPELTATYVDPSDLITSLSDHYLLKSGLLPDFPLMESIMADFFQKLQQKLDTETTTTLLYDYGRFFFEELHSKGSLTLEKNIQLKVGTLKKKCDRFRLSITNEDVKSLTLDFLHKLKDDRRLNTLSTNATGHSSLYPLVMDALITKVDSLPPSTSTAPAIEMVVITDGRRILGRTLSIKEVSFGYAELKKHHTICSKETFSIGKKGTTTFGVSIASTTNTKKAPSVPSINSSAVRTISSTKELADYLEEAQVATFLSKVAATISPDKAKVGQALATQLLDWLRH